MTAATLSAWRRPASVRNTTSSFMLALAMHALLFLSLWITVQWRTQPQAPVMAELWSALPEPVEVAPPPPAVIEKAPEPEPERPQADIVVKQEKKLPPPKKVEQKKPEPDRRRLEEEKRAADKREAVRKAEEEKRSAAQREAVRKAEEKRMLAQAGAPASGPPGTGRGDASYAAQLVALIRPRIVFAVPDGTSPQVYADFQVDLLPTGEILGVKLLKPSGLAGYDAAVERAIRRTDPFPRRRDGTVERTVIIRFRPVDVQ